VNCANAPPIKIQRIRSRALDHRALNLNHAQIVILNLFQDNKQLLRVILKQVQDDDDSDIQHDALIDAAL
jgi:hypothetical protein